MRRVFWVLFAVVAFFAFRAAASVHSQSDSMLAFFLVAAAAGLLGAALLSAAGRLRDTLPGKIVNRWRRDLARWADEEK